MTKTHTIRKRVEGEVKFNDGEFTEVLIYGIEGIEKDLLLDTIQFHRCDTSDTPEQFRQRFAVGRWLDISTTTEISVQSGVVMRFRKQEIPNKLPSHPTLSGMTSEV
jgi:hypothetical protein